MLRRHIENCLFVDLDDETGGHVLLNPTVVQRSSDLLETHTKLNEIVFWSQWTNETPRKSNAFFDLLLGRIVTLEGRLDASASPIFSTIQQRPCNSVKSHPGLAYWKSRTSPEWSELILLNSVQPEEPQTLVGSIERERIHTLNQTLASLNREGPPTSPTSRAQLALIVVHRNVKSFLQTCNHIQKIIAEEIAFENAKQMQQATQQAVEKSQTDKFLTGYTEVGGRLKTCPTDLLNRSLPKWLKKEHWMRFSIAVSNNGCSLQSSQMHLLQADSN